MSRPVHAILTNGEGLALLCERYELRECIGKGGMADVYLALDRRLSRMVAVKVLAPSYIGEPGIADRFQREVQLTAGLNHPHIVVLYDCGTLEEAPFLVMEHVDGPDLAAYLRQRGRLPEAEALALAGQIAAALDAAHNRGIIHRDIKPHNVLLDPSGRVKVTDFGVAHALGVGDLTYTTALIGTPHYLAPEQVQGRPIDARSDLYSLGVLLYELLTGELPYREGMPAAVALQHVHAELPNPQTRRPDLSAATVAVLRKALAKEPAQRYQSAADMRAALAEAQQPRGWTIVAAEVLRARAALLPLAAPRARASLAVVGVACVFGLGWLVAATPGGGEESVISATTAAAAVAHAIATPAASPALPQHALVPAVAGLPVVEARAALAAAGFKWEVREEATLDTPAGVVVTQEPLHDQPALPGSPVRLLVSTGVQVPDLVGRPCAETRAELAARGWAIRPVRWRIAHVRDFGNVVEQDPPAGAILPTKGEIRVHMAGPVRPC